MLSLSHRNLWLFIPAPPRPGTGIPLLIVRLDRVNDERRGSTRWLSCRAEVRVSEEGDEPAIRRPDWRPANYGLLAGNAVGGVERRHEERLDPQLPLRPPIHQAARTGYSERLDSTSDGAHLLKSAARQCEGPHAPVATAVADGQEMAAVWRPDRRLVLVGSLDDRDLRRRAIERQDVYV